MIAMLGGEIAVAEQNIDLMYSVCVNHGEWASTRSRTCTDVSWAVTQLYRESESSQTALLEESTRPLLT